MRLIFVSIIMLGVFACIQKKNVTQLSYSLLNKIDSNNFSFECIDSLLTGKTVVFLFTRTCRPCVVKQTIK